MTRQNILPSSLKTPPNCLLFINVHWWKGRHCPNDTLRCLPLEQMSGIGKMLAEFLPCSTIPTLLYVIDEKLRFTESLIFGIGIDSFKTSRTRHDTNFHFQIGYKIHGGHAVAMS
ncbi:hypothetical protein CEXT_234931 [Caerostris extrusa]|uniref:Uncharacterized protein n=1 Tax=Caerostris extrusa TaxID=172846 RepID=A0AAV4N3Y7_CAEEX|nr:hypothetical protein CEXT_234931 [Caerostris extrusa]